MLSFNQINFLFNLLLNKNINHHFYLKLRNLNKESLIKKIQQSAEYKNHTNNVNIFLKKFIQETFSQQVSSQELNKFKSILIYFKFNKQKFLDYYNKKIYDIKKEYKETYNKILNIDENINNNELYEIIKLDISVDIFISTSEKFHKKCEERIEKLL
tara:strand:+ start:3139 stop:3609 length:471 start_codon:yes stop_codon:yes gene_type:complete